MKKALGQSVASRGAALLVALAASGSTTAYAGLQDYEPFDYTGTTLNTQNGGTGWSGAWLAKGATSIQLSNDGVSLSYPSSFESPMVTPATMGSRVSTAGVGGNAATSSERLLSQPINLSEEGNVRFASALVLKTAANGLATNDSILLEFFDIPGNRRFGFGIEGTGDKPWLNHNGSTTPPAGGAVTPGSTYFMVAKVISHATTPDEYFLKVFGTDYGSLVPVAEPTTWDATGTTSTGAILDRIRVRIDAGNTTTTPGQVDEIRIGDSWASVVGVNETFDPGDFDEDGDVDGDDLTQWGGDFGGPGSDADDDDDSDGNDFLIWQQNYTGPLSTTAAKPVPEPNSFGLLALALLACGMRASKFSSK